MYVRGVIFEGFLAAYGEGASFGFLLGRFLSGRHVEGIRGGGKESDRHGSRGPRRRKRRGG